jgi:hypothetical protein
MEKYIDRDITGFTLKTTNNKLIIEMPLSNLINGFEGDPQNFDGEENIKIKRGMKREFLKWIAEMLQDECDPDTGDNYLSKMMSSLFMRLYEGYEDVDFVKYPEDEDEDT